MDEIPSYKQLTKAHRVKGSFSKIPECREDQIRLLSIYYSKLHGRPLNKISDNQAYGAAKDRYKYAIELLSGLDNRQNIILENLTKLEDAINYVIFINKEIRKSINTRNIPSIGIKTLTKTQDLVESLDERVCIQLDGLYSLEECFLFSGQLLLIREYNRIKGYTEEDFKNKPSKPLEEISSNKQMLLEI